MPLAIAVLAGGLACGDGSATASGLPGRGALSVEPVFMSSADGMPVIELAKARALLIRQGTRTPDTLVAEALFEEDSAVLRFDVIVVAPSQLFALEVEAFDEAGVPVFRGLDSVRIAPGDAAARGAPRMRYVAPDTAVVALLLSPADTVIDAGAVVPVSATGFAADETVISDVRVGWLVRDPLAATVVGGGVVHASNLERETWLIARTYPGVTDSARVRVRGEIASLAITPESTTMLVGETVTVFAEGKDPAGTPLSGPRDEVAWSTLDPKIASVVAQEQALSGTTETTRSLGISAASITALASGVARIVASANGHADTAYVSIEELAVTIARTEVQPKADTLAVGDSVRFVAASYDASGAAVPGQYSWLTRDSLIATVSPLGDVIALAPGVTWIVVEEIGGTTDSAEVLVLQTAASASIGPSSGIAALVRSGRSVAPAMHRHRVEQPLGRTPLPRARSPLMPSKHANGCTFCDLIRGAAEVSVCYEDADAIAFMDIQPVNPGHVLVVPKRHYESLVDIPHDLAMHLYEVAMTLGPVVRTVSRAEGMNVVVNSGSAAGQDVFHYHVHLIPRQVGDGFEIALPFPGSGMPDRTQLDAYAAQIIATLRDPVRHKEAMAEEGVA